MPYSNTKRLLKKVKDDYTRIAKDFDRTRQEPWEEFRVLEGALFVGARVAPSDRQSRTGASPSRSPCSLFGVGARVASLESPTVLDLGCGNGRLYSFLKTKKINYCGMDNNATLLKIAQKNHPDARFLRGDQLHIPLAEMSCDQIWNIAAFHHLPTHTVQKKALREMNRVLKKNGRLMLTVWNLWQKKYRPYITKNGDAFIPFGPVNRYYYAFRLGELRKLLASTGFKIIDSFCTRRGKKVPWRESFNLCFVCEKRRSL